MRESTLKKLYRVDRGAFKPGELISPAGNYQDRFAGFGKAMEDLLEKERPTTTKPDRKKSLFLFKEEREADRYWRTNDGRYVYEVEIDESTILHRGDMNLTDAIGKEFRKAEYGGNPNQDLATALAKRYWREPPGSGACIEILVASATARQLVRSKSNLKEYIKSQVTSGGVADVEPIEDILRGKDS
jgi:hypothetical protein